MGSTPTFGTALESQGESGVAQAPTPPDTAKLLPALLPDPEAALLGLVKLAVDAGDLETAKRALAELEARRRERAGVVDLDARRAKKR